jgi:N-acetylglucosaminyl-diphospho-decaprenol L-rhamnosyltransferase
VTSVSTTTVAVVIVSYRSAELTVRCLESLVAERESSKCDIHVFVVDNASGDYPLLEKEISDRSWHSWVSLILAPRNGGFGYGNNIAVAQAFAKRDPKYIYLLNPDTEARSGVIKTLASFLDEHTSVGIVGSGFENLDGTDWPIAFRFPSVTSEMCHCLDIGFVSRMFRDSLVPRIMTKVDQPTDWVSGASMMVRSDVFRKIGGFDENYFLYFEETDFSYRAKRQGYDTWYVPSGIVMHVSGYSTHVTSKDIGPRRLPAYWFE